MTVGLQDYYGIKPGCCRVCSGCNDPWNCAEMKCHVCYWYEYNQFTDRGRCTYQFQPRTYKEKLRGMLSHVTRHFSELPPKSVKFYTNLALDNPEWNESKLFMEKVKESYQKKESLTPR